MLTQVGGVARARVARGGGGGGGGSDTDGDRWYLIIDLYHPVLVIIYLKHYLYSCTSYLTEVVTPTVVDCGHGGQVGSGI